MYRLPKSIQKLIAELAKLPSIGQKSAERLAYYLISNKEVAGEIAQSITKSLESIRLCETCFFVSEESTCSICADSSREQATICIVEKPADVVAIETAGIYRGHYHVLHGLWSPLKGKDLDKMHLPELKSRIQDKNIKEVILATGSTVEGDATALYIGQILTEIGVKATRLAQGLPKGGELEYLDDVTLTRALEGRISVNQG